MFWNSRVIKNLEAQTDLLKKLLADAQERNDRLVEALARKSGIDLVLPQRPVVTEKSEGWFDVVKIKTGEKQ